MRYEHIELDISTATMSHLHNAVSFYIDATRAELNAESRAELGNLVNQLEARLQRRDVDQHCPRNFEKSSKSESDCDTEELLKAAAEGWLDT